MVSLLAMVVRNHRADEGTTEISWRAQVQEVYVGPNTKSNRSGAGQAKELKLDLFLPASKPHARLKVRSGHD